MPDLLRTEVAPLVLDQSIDLDQAHAVAARGRAIALSPAARDRLAQSEARLRHIIDDRRHVYGITTGFGPLANRLIDTADAVTLQQNLVYHLASGQGAPFGWAEARAIVLARLMSVLQGGSGATPATVDLLVAVLNAGLAPVIPQRGTVGASGDLTPLAHMVLCLQARGGFLLPDGTEVTGAEALGIIGQAPLALDRRDGLALVNGTSAMTGVALCNAWRARRLCDWALALSAVMGEVLEGRPEAWNAHFDRVRPHAGQAEASARLRARITGTDRMVAAPIAERRLDAGPPPTEEEPGQDAYTLRCVPQIIGAVLDTLAWHDSVTRTELNAITDNPVFPPEDSGLPPALHGGNFMGQHVALASDALSTAVTVLAGLAERQMARVSDEKLNRGLPPFLQSGPAGLHSGFMGAQVTATALVAEIRCVGPASVQSISTNGANQDVVSMGTIAARLVSQKLDRLSEVLAILALALAQAQHLRSATGEGFSPAARAVAGLLRQVAPPLDEDRPLAPDITKVARLIQDCAPPDGRADTA